MQGLLITAALTASVPQGAPGEIVYIPDGSHTITPTVNGKPKNVTISIPAGKGESIAAALQADLTKRNGENVRPHVAFDHKSGPAAAIPKAFRYQAGQGIILELDWSSSGKAAVEGRDYSYFSPCFLVDDHGVPSGLPSRGEIGSLVNEPAFREIPRIAATDNPEPAKISQTMNKVYAALNIDPAHADAESAAGRRVTELVTAAANHTSVITAKDTEIAELKTKLTVAETKIQAADKKRADDLVKAAVADGRLAPADTEKQEKFRTKIAAGDEFAEDMLAMLPKSVDPTKPLVSASAADPAAARAGEHAFVTEARALVTAKQAANDDEAFDKVAASKPELYSDYLESLTSKK